MAVQSGRLGRLQRYAQRSSDDPCCKAHADIMLIDASLDTVSRTSLLAACSLGSSDWLDALPLFSVGDMMSASRSTNSAYQLTYMCGKSPALYKY